VIPKESGDEGNGEKETWGRWLVVRKESAVRKGDGGRWCRWEVVTMGSGEEGK